MSDADADAPGTFTEVDWSTRGAERRFGGLVLTRRTWTLAATLLALAGAFVYDYLVIPSGYALIWSFSPSAIDWLALLSLVFALFYVVVPLASSPRIAYRYWRHIRHRPTALGSLGYLVLLVIAGLFGPTVYGHPSDAPAWAELKVRGTPGGLPPFWTSRSIPTEYYCPTQVVDGRCVGSIVHPLGTTIIGHDVLAYVFAGARVALEVTVISAALLVPVATVVGTVAAYAGGWLDDLLMRYADLQAAIPAFLLYFLYQFLYGGSVVVLVLLFGLFDWDRIARRVRDDAVRIRNTGYVTAAESAGSRPLDVLRRHIAPNVSGTILAGLSTQIPFILIMEATFSYLGIVDSDVASWGYAIATGFHSGLWWIWLFPTIALVLSALSITVLGRTVHEAIQERGTRE